MEKGERGLNILSIDVGIGWSRRCRCWQLFFDVRRSRPTAIIINNDGLLFSALHFTSCLPIVERNAKNYFIVLYSSKNQTPESIAHFCRALTLITPVVELNSSTPPLLV